MQWPLTCAPSKSKKEAQKNLQKIYLAVLW
jgi:hypothetical protein